MENSEEDIKATIKEYIKVSDDIDAVNKDSKVLRERKKSLESSIQEYMITNSVSKVSLGNSGSLRVSTTKVQKKLGRSSVFEILLENLEEDKSEKIIKELFDEEEHTVTKLERKKK